MASDPSRETLVKTLGDQVRTVFKAWWDTFGLAPDGASVTHHTLHRLGVEIGRAHKEGNFLNVYEVEMEFAFGAKLYARKPGYAQHPVEYFSYYRAGESMNPVNELSAAQDFILKLSQDAPPDPFAKPYSHPTGQEG
jgi:hypothetical protein